MEHLFSPLRAEMAIDSSSFLVQCLGQVDSGSFESHDYLYCRYNFTYGMDWDIISGIDTGISQTAIHNQLVSEDNLVVWNFPIDISFKSTNIYGWPRIAVSVYGIDYFGRDVIRGYGSALIPLQPGNHRIQIDMFKPVANSYFNQVMGWIWGNPPEVLLNILMYLSNLIALLLS